MEADGTPGKSLSAPDFLLQRSLWLLSQDWSERVGLLFFPSLLSEELGFPITTDYPVLQAYFGNLLSRKWFRKKNNSLHCLSVNCGISRRRLLHHCHWVTAKEILSRYRGKKIMCPRRCTFVSSLSEMDYFNRHFSAFLHGWQGMKLNDYSAFTPIFEEKLTSWRLFYANFAKWNDFLKITLYVGNKGHSGSLSTSAL